MAPMAELAQADTSGAVASGAVTGGLRTLLRLEGLTLFLGMTLLYAVWGGAWWVYLILFLGAGSEHGGLSCRPQGRRHRL
jgi:hypothetical protein